jgi:hypothetical protein
MRSPAWHDHDPDAVSHSRADADRSIESKHHGVVIKSAEAASLGPVLAEERDAGRPGPALTIVRILSDENAGDALVVEYNEPVRADFVVDLGIGVRCSAEKSDCSNAGNDAEASLRSAEATLQILDVKFQVLCASSHGSSLAASAEVVRRPPAYHGSSSALHTHLSGLHRGPLVPQLPARGRNVTPA